MPPPAVPSVWSVIDCSAFFFFLVLNVNGLTEREPVIYHGHTLTTKIAFRDVIHAINVS